MIDAVVESMLRNSVDMREMLKSRRDSFMIMMAGAETSRMAIVCISVAHFEYINRFSEAFRLEFKASDIPSGKQAFESP
jgi:hypothetical protein